tara:strand:- start:24323 stop:24505 length:183 start_codon:yes stop_codon:yes gene_type:complete
MIERHDLGVYHIKKYYGRNLSLMSLNTAINWTNCAYTYLGESFTFFDKLIIFYNYLKKGK